MKPWELDDIRRAVKGKWLMRPEALRAFNGHVCTDSRKAAKGDLFFALKGERFDAHDFVADVLAREVAVVIVNRDMPAETIASAKHLGATVIQVDDTIAALNRLAAAYRQEMRAKVIAVGGSNGKTTTKRIIHTLLREKFGVQAGHASPKSFNNNIGMPLTLLEVEPSHDYVVLEIGTNAPGEIAALGEVCRPDIAVITSVGLEHLEKLVDLDGVAREEASVASFVADGGTLVLQADAPELLAALKATRAQRILVGHTGEAEFLLTDVRATMAGTEFSINGRGAFKLPLLGEHNAMNALMAIAVARRMGVSDQQIAAGLAKVTAADGRLQPVRAGGWCVINDAYNANPSSMEAALKTFAGLEPRARKVVILGDMLELGPASAALHRSIGALVAAHEFALLIAIGPAMRLAADAAEAAAGAAGGAGVKTARFENTIMACDGLLALLEPGDHILLKGSHGMALETLLPVLSGAVFSPVAAI